MTHYLLSAYNSNEQNFSSREFRDIFELKQDLHYTEQKKVHQRVSTECFENHSEEKTWFYFAFQKRNFLALSHLF